LTRLDEDDQESFSKLKLGHEKIAVDRLTKPITAAVGSDSFQQFGEIV